MHHCQFVLALCQTDLTPNRAIGSIRYPLWSAIHRSFTSNDVGEKMGIKMTATGELSFNNVKVPCVALVGRRTKAFIRFLIL